MGGHVLGGEQCHVSTEQEPLNGAHRKARLVRITRIMHISLISMLVRKTVMLVKYQQEFVGMLELTKFQCKHTRRIFLT